MIDAQKIPGMIEPVEQALLTELAARPPIVAGAVIVEFGTFFGRSSACLVNGASQWWTPADGPVLRTYDSFGCAEGEGFAPHVFAFAGQGGVLDLVERANGRVDFQKVYRRYLGAAEEAGLLVTRRAELRDIEHDGAPISLMHLDAPKFYDEFKFILFRFFPSLVPEARVVFQDYFYHWSATLVAAAEALVARGILAFERSAASSMTARVVRTPSVEDLLEVDLALTGRSVEPLLDQAIARTSTMALDRGEQFAPRLWLAKMQYQWEQGRTADADRTFGAMIAAAKGRLHVATLADLREMLRSGFSIRPLYERDH
jgi:hypothetical protein